MNEQRDLKGANYVMLSAFESTKTNDIGCIFYIFDKGKDGCGTGFSTRNSDKGDALVAITRIMDKFGINKSALNEALQ